MQIAYIAAGAAGMYCGSCLHDNTLARTLMKQGHDVVLVPTYTPLRTDEQNVSHRRVFFGGINVYLQQKFRLFRHTPHWFDRLLDSPALLRLATRGGPSVDPARLGDLTVSMLRGEEGHQSKELEKLVGWLLDDVQPDVVHLSNSMLLGFARRIAQRCGPPVVCSLSGEDIFLEKLKPPYYGQVRALLRERAEDVAAFVAMNNHYADYMAEYLSVPRQRVHVAPHGVDLEGHSPADSPPKQLIIGYLARICHDKGLHQLIEACEHLVEKNPSLDFQVRAAGYLSDADKAYLREIEQRANSGPLYGRFEYMGELTRAEKITFLQSLSLFALPTVYRESKGLPVLEAWASGVPVVLPEHGSFSEMIADTGGGLLHEPHNARHLAEKLYQLLTSDELRQDLGAAGRAAVVDRYHADEMAARTLAIYRSLVE